MQQRIMGECATFGYFYRVKLAAYALLTGKHICRSWVKPMSVECKTGLNDGPVTVLMHTHNIN